MAKLRPTRQMVVLRAYIRASSVAAAAYELGISETTVRQHLSGLYRRTGCVNAAWVAYWLGAPTHGAPGPVCSATSLGHAEQLARRPHHRGDPLAIR